MFSATGHGTMGDGMRDDGTTGQWGDRATGDGTTGRQDNGTTGQRDNGARDNGMTRRRDYKPASLQDSTPSPTLRVPFNTSKVRKGAFSEDFVFRSALRCRA